MTNLTPPPGYGRIVLLDRKRHAGLGVKPGLGQHWCTELNAVYLAAAEIARAALDMPVAFTRISGSPVAVPVAILGLGARRNLFVDAAGQWRADCYQPAFIRRHPFCLLEHPGGKQPRIAVAEDALTAGDQPLFDAQGQETPHWQAWLKLLQASEAARRQTAELMELLEELELLQAFDAVSLPRQGTRSVLRGLLRVNEPKLNALPARDLRRLLKDSGMRSVQAHLLSLEHFRRLQDWSER